MKMVVTYRIDKDLYDDPDINHNILMGITIHRYKSSKLLMMKYSDNLRIRLNNLFQYELKKDKDIPDKLYFFKKMYRKKGFKLIPQRRYERKIKKFNMGETQTRMEFLEKYAYQNKNNQPDAVRIVISEKNGAMIGVIDFADAEQYKNFVSPPWLYSLADSAVF